ncbi:tetratricopeptide repeat protein [Salinisphaera sp. Q1T1-3]|uniref:YfgM family protein n=1 Tax=Salinisphaera sp. Q1T1-3 TaxID=2321229 RepID=UPI000E7702E9|nr:tetratricopeptide repeat protein [Salinisphaera sp. Q1T1-3]RJS92323.1 hypothetical protein D3260_11790 [Salinisphaera sp. Q1T1-3]
MAQLENEEFDTARRWWRKNGTAAIVGIVIGVVVLAGWYGWHWYQARQNNQAADMYAQVSNGIGQGNVTGGMVNLVNTLQSDYAGTPYAGAAALALGGYYVDQGQLDKAAPRLDWAANNAQDKGMRAIATVRDARIRWAQNKPDAALKLLDGDHPPAFDALFAELAGDIHLAQGDRQAAHAAFRKALDRLPSDVPRQPLTEKLQSSAPAGATSSDADSASDSASNNASDAS